MRTFPSCPDLERMLSMDSLRIDNGLKKIEVNDAGEYIEFSVVDSGFFRAFFDLLQWFDEQENRKEIKEIEEQGDKVVSDDGSKVNYDAANSVLDIHEKISKEACEKIDNIFGAEASRKIFGSIVPDMYMVADFFKQITPFIEKYAKERNQSINKKYSKSRNGAKS